MGIERVSLRSLTIVVVLLLGLLPLVHTLIAKIQFRDAALESKVESMSRVLQVSSAEILAQLHRDMLLLNAALQENNRLETDLVQRLRGGDNGTLRASLDDPFVNGFVGIRQVDLVRLRAYDLHLNHLVDSGAGDGSVPAGLPAFLRQQASQRRGVERLKAIGGLWSMGGRPYYSLLVPVGGLRPVGYLELVANPSFNLVALSQVIGMPLRILNSRGQVLSSSPDWVTDDAGRLPVSYALRGDDSRTALRLIANENVAHLYSHMHDTQVHTTVVFISLTLVTMLLALWTFKRFLVQPTERMLQDIHRCTAGDLHAAVDSRGLKEFHRLAEAFNTMNATVRDRTERLQQLSTLDGLTGIGNRRRFDQVLEQEWQRAAQDGRELSLLFIDLDYFKRYNDTYGHQAGDDCLRAIGKVLAGQPQQRCNFAARYGGEEFAMILPATSCDAALAAARELNQAVEALAIPHENSDVAAIITLSIGIACCRPGLGTTPYLLVAGADEALYRAKDQGRNRIEITEVTAMGDYPLELVTESTT